MKVRDFVLVGVWAMASAMVALSLWAPRSLNAVDAAADKAAIATPVLEANGCRLSVQLAKGTVVSQDKQGVFTVKAGETPTFDLIANNPSEKAATFNCTVVYTRGSLADMISRVPRNNDDSSWQNVYSISLKAGETKRITITPQATIAAATNQTQIVNGGAALMSQARGEIRLAVDSQTITAARYVVEAATATPAVKSTGATPAAAAPAQPAANAPHEARVVAAKS